MCECGATTRKHDSSSDTEFTCVASGIKNQQSVFNCRETGSCAAHAHDRTKRVCSVWRASIYADQRFRRTCGYRSDARHISSSTDEISQTRVSRIECRRVRRLWTKHDGVPPRLLPWTSGRAAEIIHFEGYHLRKLLFYHSKLLQFDRYAGRGRLGIATHGRATSRAFDELYAVDGYTASWSDVDA